MEDLNRGAADAAGVEGNMNILVTGMEGYIGSCSGSLLDGEGPFCYGPRYRLLP